MISVLIAEDNAGYRETLRQVLTGRFPSMQITESADGEDALHQALARPYDLIFMDIRLPQASGLDVTRAIKAVFADVIICVITSHDLPEYRDAAFRNGADRFLVKGDTSGEEIVAVVESLLQSRFRTLVLVSDPLSRKQLVTLLSVRWPVMIVVEAENATEGLGKAVVLKPDLVLLDLRLPDRRLEELVRSIKAASAQARVVGMATDDLQAYRAIAMGCGVDYCVPLDPMGHTQLVAIVNDLHAGPVHH